MQIDRDLEVFFLCDLYCNPDHHADEESTEMKIWTVMIDMPQCLFNSGSVRELEVDGTGVSLAECAVKNF